MIPVKTALSVSVILASAGLAGCQTTEERAYYAATPVVSNTTYVYEDAPYGYYRPPMRHYRSPANPPPFLGRPDPRRPFYGGPVDGPRHPYYHGPRYDPRRYPYNGRRFVPTNNGNSPGYDTQ